MNCCDRGLGPDVLEQGDTHVLGRGMTGMTVLMNAVSDESADRGKPLRPMAQQWPAGGTATHIR
ncbi:hypothetical protein ACIRD6_25965 [Streptomyces sp. NPDC102473]|uniref:hypothetical protein n=1 Tax=Streptomyces sp. NPDC102473 TaxID=3366180 RepID=UPI00382C6669